MSSNTVEGNGGGQAAGAIDDDEFRTLYSDLTSKKKELKRLKTGLPTPAASLEPDDERVKADKERIAKEEVALKEALTKVNEAADQKTKAAIERIISCPDEAYDDILNIREDVKEEDKKLARDKSFVLLGCLVHPGYTLGDQALNAYLKLHVAADRMDLNGSYIEAVKDWDGEEDIINFKDDSEMPDANDNASQVKPELPTWVAEIHGKALEPLKELFGNPNSPGAMSALNEIDQQIEKGVGGSESKEERAEWALKPNVFKLYFAELKRLNAISPEDPSHSTTKVRRNVVINLLDTTIKKLLSTTPGDEKQIEKRNKTCEAIVNLIELRNYPKDWKYIHELKQMDYPWHTVPIGNTTSRIIGVREVGRGKQVCIEIMEGGCWIRRLEAASETEFGTQATEEYFAHENSKNFSKGQSKWSKEDKSAFQKLHWCRGKLSL
ncbi:hypothetical protein THAR02_11182 [Trichoderma harzianum]|uniref:Uncharacterized protein n=1 Tax=Trichoderma harzianum TaxID=5544 RepID=A0A0F9Z7X6_TRIHA|nr:hypothetical protein THAR02_11182 [Trichoderma harzianum]